MPVSPKTPKASEAAKANHYIAALPVKARTGLRSLQRAIASALPGATLGISYGIPAFKLNGRPVVWFAGFKQHSSFFPGVAAIRSHVAELKAYRTSKGTIQFPPDKPLPPNLVASLVKARLTEMQKKRR